MLSCELPSLCVVPSAGSSDYSRFPYSQVSKDTYPRSLRNTLYRNSARRFSTDEGGYSSTGSPPSYSIRRSVRVRPRGSGLWTGRNPLFQCVVGVPIYTLLATSQDFLVKLRNSRVPSLPTHTSITTWRLHQNVNVDPYPALSWPSVSRSL